MQLPESASEGAKWLLLVGLAFFSADAISALIGRHLEVPDSPLPPALVAVVQESVPAQAASADLIRLLKTTEPKVEQENRQLENGVGESVQADSPQMRAISLQGTIAGSNGAGLAILEFQGMTRVLGSGDELDGFTIKSVTSHSVTLESGGRAFTLEIASNAEIPPAQSLRPALPVQATAQPAPESEAKEEESTDPIFSLTELRGLLDNPEEFMGDGFLAKPEVVDGEVAGMRIRLSNPTHPLARLGIRDGDLVKSLNGTPLQGPESLTEVYRVLRNSQTLRFDVERGGQSETVEVQLEE